MIGLFGVQQILNLKIYIQSMIYQIASIMNTLKLK